MTSIENKLIIHMGLHKTGTKSIQSFFSEFRDPISAAGLYYPMSGCVGLERAHHNIYRYYSQKAEEKSRFDPRAGGGAELNNEVKDLNKDVFISSEGFWVLARDEPERFAEFVSNVSAGRRVLLIITWRNAAEYCESLYFQHAKTTQMVGIDKAVKSFFSIPAEFERVVTFLSTTMQAETLIIQYNRDMLEVFLNMMSTNLDIRIDRKLKGIRQSNLSLSSAQKLIAAHLSLSNVRFDTETYRKILDSFGEGTSRKSLGEDGSIMPEGIQRKLLEMSVQGLRNILKTNARVDLYPEGLPDQFETRPCLIGDSGILTFPKLRAVLEAI
jgi:hypothetical protein